LREENRVRVFENRVLKRVFWPWRDEETREWRRLQKEEPIICTPNQVLFRWLVKSRRMRWRRVWNMCVRGDTCTVFWFENLRERDLLEDIGVDGRLILK
jgi:hypothetical protein